MEINQWMSQKHKGFPKWITKSFVSNNDDNDETIIASCDVKTERMSLFPHQKFVRDYMQHKSPYRGILLYHGLGVGKTCASIAVAEIMNNQRDIIVLLPASLQMNYRNEIMKCGDSKFAVDQHWTFTPTKKYVTIGKEKNIDPKLLKKMKGYWSFDNTKSPNFYKLTSLEQQQIRMQISDTISKKYNFINYNGLTLKKFKEMSEKENIFDNKLVIIDEAHLFISTVVNKSSVSTEIYKDMINANNIKIVLLTGTPIINYPNEIAYTFNLLNGLNKIYKIYYNGSFINQVYLEKSEMINEFHVKDKNGHRSIEIDLTPFGFQKNEKQMLVFTNDQKTDEEKMEKITDDLKKSGVKFSKYSDKAYYLEEHKLFPTEKKAFDDLFINYDDHTVKNEQLFMRRTMGIVSYFESSDASLYPTNLGVVHEVLPFSDHQFGKYAQVRDKEIKKEKNMKKFSKQGDGLFSENGVYKTFSRTLCNFAFPDEIERPFPKQRISFMNTELDIDDDYQVNVDELEKDLGDKLTGKKIYERNVKKALDQLDELKEQYLNDSNLKTFSPKFKKIIENINKTNGNVLVYSQFKTLEGLGILGLCLKARGYAEMKISLDKDNNITIDVAEEDYLKPKYAMFSTDRDISNVILKIFNSDVNSLGQETISKLRLMNHFDNDVTPNNLHGELIKILMITQSGSAGISLKNVRQVHIVEPYWNKSRIDQVIGRANRTCSHIDLPIDERNFKVFMYRMKMTAEQNKKSAYIRSTDKLETTDESIYNLAERKDKIVSKLLLNIKRASVDCALNKNKINHGLECFAYPLDIDDFEKAYLEDIIEDKNMSIDEQRTKRISVKPFKVTIEGTTYIWIANTNELFDYELYRKTGFLHKLGHLQNNKDGWYKITLLKNK